MSTTKKLGKIAKAYVGLGGYQDVQFGLHLTFSGEGWVVSSSFSCWDPARMECSETAKWTEADRDKELSKIGREISKSLKQARVEKVEELKGIPVRVSFDGPGAGSVITGWEILEEVP